MSVAITKFLGVNLGVDVGGGTLKFLEYFPLLSHEAYDDPGGGRWGEVCIFWVTGGYFSCECLRTLNMLTILYARVFFFFR